MKLPILSGVAAFAGVGLALAAGPSFTIHAPGTVFTDGQRLSFDVSNVTTTVAWQVQDWHGKTVVAGKAVKDGPVRLDPLPIGYYRLTMADGGVPDGYRTFAVVADRSKDPRRSVNSMYGTDAAFSWCCQRGCFACPWMQGDTPSVMMRLMQIAGFSHVRDRFSWDQTNPAPNRTAFGKYLDNARRLSQAGLSVTTCFADTPKHVAKLRLLPSDLVALYRHCKTCAEDFGSAVDCWEF